MTPSEMTELDAIRPITLAELQSVAALDTRVDRKYLVDRTMLGLALDMFRDEARVLEIDGLRSFDYESWYFDTPTWDAYLGSAHRRRHRFKVRTRSYLDTGSCAIELKVRDHRGLTAKIRRPHPIKDRHRLTPYAHAFLRGCPAVETIAEQLCATARITYQRSTLVIGNSRITLDTDLACVSTQNLYDHSVGVGDLVVVETKNPRGSCAVDHALWQMHLRPIPLSKYGTGLAALHPELPSNKWHRTLVRHFTREEAL